MTGILDVARAARVSPATVSRALRGLPGVSDATRTQVQEAAARLGYSASPAASSLSSGRTNTIGVIAPWVTRWYFTALIDGVNSVLSPSGFDMLLFGTDTDQQVSAAKLSTMTKRVDGLVALCLPELAQQASALSQPPKVVLVGADPPELVTVAIDDGEVGRLAGRHLISLGHRRIGYVGMETVSPRILPVAQQRHRGLLEVMGQAGLRMDEGDVISCALSVAGGEASAEALCARVDRPTAVVAVSDEIAMGLIHRLRLLGVRVPEDMSVVGVDGHEMSRVFGLTTVVQPVREQGAIAVRLLMDALAGATTESVLTPVSLAVRSTTAAPAAPVGTGSTERRTRVPH